MSTTYWIVIHARLMFLMFGLMSNISNSQECSMTTSTQADALGPFYVESSPQTQFFGPSDQLSDPSKRLEISGRIFSVRNCRSNEYLPMGDIRVEAWYAGEPDDQGNYYQVDQYRGQVVTDKCGFYSFVQTFPEIYPTRPIIHTHFRVADSNDNELLVTQLYFKGDGKGYYNDNSVSNVLGERRDSQAVSVEVDANGTRRVTFEIFLDTDGNMNCSATSTAPFSVSTPMQAPAIEPFSNETTTIQTPSYTLEPILSTVSPSSGTAPTLQQPCSTLCVSIFSIIGCGFFCCLIGV